MKKLIIDRNKWLRGAGNEDSKLLREMDNKMCCLGFACVQLGNLSKWEILEVSTPAELYNDQDPNLGKSELTWLIIDSSYGAENSSVCNDLMNFNDDKNILVEEDRENKIAEIFKRHGIEVEFIN